MPSGLRFSEREGDARCAIAARGVRSVTGLPSIDDLAAVGAVGAEEQPRELGAPGAEQPGQADDLARDGRRGRTAAIAPLAAEPVARSGRGVRLGLGDASRGARLLELVEDGRAPADHRLHQLDPRQLGRRGTRRPAGRCAAP